MASGAVEGAGGALLIDNLRVTEASGSGSAGCMDSDASNYDAAATTDDGSCVYAVTFSVDMSDQTLADTVNADLDLVETNAAAVDAFLGGTTDITGDLEGLRDDIEGVGADGTVSVAELTTFVGSL